MTTLHTDGLSHGYGSLHLVRQFNVWHVYMETDKRHGELLVTAGTKAKAVAGVERYAAGEYGTPPWNQVAA